MNAFAQWLFNPSGLTPHGFCLPFGDVTKGAAPASDPDTSADSASVGNLHVLVVDDVQMNRDIAENFLLSAGHRVTSVEGGLQAVHAVAATDFDMVLMDVRMPDMDGLEATRRIRALGGAPACVPIIGLTAYAYKEQVADCEAAGMDGHLAKPFEPETLFATVRRAAHAACRRRATDAAPASAGGREALAAPRAADEADGSLFDEVIFERTCAVLAPETSSAYLRKLDLMCDVLTHDVRARHGSALYDRDLADSAHILAGSAGMFGFLRLAMIGRNFEHDLLRQSPDLSLLADKFCQVMEAAQREIRSRTERAA